MILTFLCVNENIDKSLWYNIYLLIFLSPGVIFHGFTELLPLDENWPCDDTTIIQVWYRPSFMESTLWKEILVVTTVSKCFYWNQVIKAFLYPSITLEHRGVSKERVSGNFCHQFAMVIRTKWSFLLQDFFPQLKNTDSWTQQPYEVLSLWKAVVSLLSGRITITVR